MADKIKLTTTMTLVRDLGSGRTQDVPLQTQEFEHVEKSYGTGEISVDAGVSDQEFSLPGNVGVFTVKKESGEDVPRDMIVKEGDSGNTGITCKHYSYRGAATSFFFSNPDGDDPITIEYSYSEEDV